MQLSLPRFERGRAICLLIGAAALLTLLIRTGWATEDSYISFRVVDNFLNGHGLTWNVGERVQVYTDPLFLFLLILVTSISGSVYWSSVVISLLMTMAAFFLLTHKRGAPVILVTTAIFLASKAFMDFSVSGMENPATHLGIAAFFWAYWSRRSPLLLTLIASFTALNRLDSLPLFLPALGWIYWQTGRKVWLDAVIGFCPLLVWEAFSAFYYGFPFPNTAYAKLGAGIDHMFLIGKGLEYFECSVAWDKVTPAVILAGLVLALWKREWPLALGLFASIFYVVWVGGDFMAGRFLTAPFVFATAIVVSHLRLSNRFAAGLSAVILLSTFLNPRPTLITTSDFGVNEKPFDISHFYKTLLGVADERAFFYRATGILRWKPGLRWPNSGWSDEGDRIRQSGVRTEIIHAAGTIPYHIGPRIHTIDAGALGDPLLAHLPAKKPNQVRPGHYYRAIPDGYFETIDTGVNRIADPKLAEYYGHLHTIVSGDLWSKDRIEEIIAMNLGRYDHLLPKRPH